MSKKKRHLLIISILASLVFLFLKNYLLINISSSMPIGFYLKKDNVYFQKGDIVVVCLPNILRQYALYRHYILKGGLCYGTTPLIKEVVACPGDQILITDYALITTTKIYHIKKFKRDSQGRALYPYPNGQYQAVGYWLLGSSSERSWDSRYFGEIKKEYLLCALKPLLIWRHIHFL